MPCMYIRCFWDLDELLGEVHGRELGITRYIAGAEVHRI